MLLDSNVIIYLYDPTYGEKIAEGIKGYRLNTCNVVVSEVLGFGGLEQTEARYFEQLFASMVNYPFDEAVTRKVTELRRRWLTVLLYAHTTPRILRPYPD
jgi:predicted nucleic acid-binding protein